MEIVFLLIKWVLMLGGLFFISVGTFGLFRMPDIYTKQHALGLIDTMGFSLISCSLMIYLGFTLISFKILFLAILILLLSAPVSYTLMQIMVIKNNIISKELEDIDNHPNPHE